MTYPTLCLTMIVKNESKIITRLFDSLLNSHSSTYIIDSYCISDTGSTDNTIQVIKDYFIAKNIPGKIISEPFKNFCYNRNLALRSAEGMSDFILLLDADMVLEIRSFDKKYLYKYDSFSLLQGNNKFYYKNTRIVKNNGLYEYKGVTHEYISGPSNERRYTIPKIELFINDIGDGGCKVNKYDRDIKLLTDGIKDEPNNERYYFYLANSYHDSGNYTKAKEIYKKRIEMKGWTQEVWYSHYRIGICYQKQDNMPYAIDSWLNGYDVLPDRLEGLYEIIKYYRIVSKHKLCLHFYKLAIKILKNLSHSLDEYLFLYKDVYTYKLYYEYSIFSAYVGVKNINNEIIQILNNCDDNTVNKTLLKNMKYYKCVILKAQNIIKKDDTIIVAIDDMAIEFISSSSSLIPNPYTSGYIMNIRYVNYRINPQGKYLNSDKHIITVNKYLQLDTKFDGITEKIFDVGFQSRLYTGIEDLRLYYDIYRDNLMYIGSGYHKDNTIGMIEGKYDIACQSIKGNEMKQREHNTNCEKNWVYIYYRHEPHIIYKWYPLEIYRISEISRDIQLVKSMCMPKIFKYIRGSSPSFKYENENWFVVHMVSHEAPRHYYHVLVVLDEDAKLLRYSAPFKFVGEPIEYCLSIIVEYDRVIMNYSAWDRTTRIGIYNKKYIDSIMKYSGGTN